MIPFAKTKAERMTNNDPRLSLDERRRHDFDLEVVGRIGLSSHRIALRRVILLFYVVDVCLHADSIRCL